METWTDSNPKTSRPWSGLLLLYLVAFLLLVMSWNRTADIVVDFGRELYVPWQMNEGVGLYRDLEYFNGPFSPIFNSVLFAVFGARKTVLVVANFCCLLGLLTLLYREFGRYQPAAVSCLQGLCVIVYAGFGHTSAMGNFNLITPYSHETTHGLLLSAAIFVILQRQRWKFGWQVVIGVLFGWVLGTKAEFGLACGGMLVAALWLRIWMGSERQNRLWLLLITTIAWTMGLSLGIAILWGFLYFNSNPFDAWQMLGSFKWILGSPVTQLAFYKKITGTDHLLYNLMGSGASLLSLALWMLGSYWLAKRKWNSPFPVIVCFALALLVGWPIVPVLMDGRMFTLLGAAILLWLLKDVFVGWNSRTIEQRSRTCQLITWFVFAEMMLAKMAFNPMLDFYGFVLAMPMAVGFASWILVEFPSSLAKGNPREPGDDSVRRPTRLVRGILLACIALDLFVFTSQSIRNLWSKTDSVRTVAETFQCDSIRGEDYMATLRFLDEIMEEEDSLLVLPEGVTLNFLLKKGSGVRYYNFMPPELVMFGLDNILETFRQSPPEFVVLWDRPVSGYQVPPFGSEEYGKELVDWVQENYKRIHQLGGGFRSRDGFGVDVYRRPRGQSED